MSERGDDLDQAHRGRSMTSSVIADHLGRIRFSDDHFVHFSQIGCRDVEGTLLEEYVIPEDRAYLRSLLSPLTGERVVGIIRFSSHGQGIVPARVVIKAGPERSTFVVTITDQSASCRELMGGEHDGLGIARAILSQTQDPLVILDANGRILMSSPSVWDLTGRDPIGLTFFHALPLEPDLDPEPYGAPYRQEESSSLAGPGPVPAAGLYRFPAHERRRIRVIVERLTLQDAERNTIPGSVVRLDDIECRLKANDRLERALEKTADSNRELQQLVYAISHDLQEPLRMISSYLQLLERRYAGRLDDAGLEFVDFAVDGARRMQELIDALLAYSRVISHARPPSPVDAGEVVIEALSRLEQKVASTGAEVTIGPMLTVNADRAQLVKVFEQLIDNALTFRSDAPPRILIDAEQVEAGTRFRVQDNGIGIASEFHELIFRIFSRLHTRDQFPGTGVGLAVVRRIIERHGGRCWLESSLGAGSTFFFSIPDLPALEET